VWRFFPTIFCGHFNTWNLSQQYLLHNSIGFFAFYNWGKTGNFSFNFGHSFKKEVKVRLRTCPHVYGYFFFVLKKTRPHVFQLNRFLPSTSKRYNDGNTMTPSSWKTFVSVRRNVNEKPAFSKVSKTCVFGARKRRFHVNERLRRRKKSP